MSIIYKKIQHDLPESLSWPSLAPTAGRGTGRQWHRARDTARCSGNPSGPVAGYPTVRLGNPLEMGDSIGKSPTNSVSSSKPSLIRG